MAKVSVLVVEDNNVNQQVALFLLKQLGYDADLATNGLDAIEKWERNDYDVILMDIQMPKMDGIEATKKIRQTSRSQPYIVALTADCRLEESQNCTEAGMDDYLSKPILLDQLEAIFTHYHQKCHSV